MLCSGKESVFCLCPGNLNQAEFKSKGQSQTWGAHRRQHWGGRDRKVSMSLSTAWSLQWVLKQLGLHRHHQKPKPNNKNQKVMGKAAWLGKVQDSNAKARAWLRYVFAYLFTNIYRERRESGTERSDKSSFGREELGPTQLKLGTELLAHGKCHLLLCCCEKTLWPKATEGRVYFSSQLWRFLSIMVKQREGK